MIRTIQAQAITSAIADLCIAANGQLPASLAKRLAQAVDVEQSPLGQAVLRDLCSNLAAAQQMDLPICQDTGMVVVFAELGQDVHIEGDFNQAIQDGVRKGYLQGYLRCSVVKDPLNRVNTGDNTPAIVHVSLVPGNQLCLTVAPKGFGSENMSRLQMMTPAATREDIIAFVVETVGLAGGNACPPLVLGVGIGGDFEQVALLAKKALCQDVAQSNPDPYYQALELDMLGAVNATGVGPQGFGGTVTALGVNIVQAPTHIAGLPVAVNVGCHVTRHKKITL